MSKWKEACERLYLSVYEAPKFQGGSYADFVAMEGMNYGTSEVKLMVVGRAVNGWGELNNKETMQDYAAEAERQRNRKDRVSQQWNLNESATECYSEYESLKKDENGNPIIVRYYPRRSSFLDMIRRVSWQLQGAVGLVGQYTMDEAFEQIVWNNLYKISPKETGNPDTPLCVAQADACIELLKEELEYFKPTHVLMVIGENWLYPKGKVDEKLNFLNAFEKIRYCSDAIEDRTVVQKAFFSGEIKVLVTSRPEGKNRETFARAVATTFRNMDEKCYG